MEQHLGIIKSILVIVNQKKNTNKKQKIMKALLNLFSEIKINSTYKNTVLVYK